MLRQSPPRVMKDSTSLKRPAVKFGNYGCLSCPLHNFKGSNIPSGQDVPKALKARILEDGVLSWHQEQDITRYHNWVCWDLLVQSNSIHQQLWMGMSMHRDGHHSVEAFTKDEKDGPTQGPHFILSYKGIIMNLDYVVYRHMKELIQVPFPQSRMQTLHLFFYKFGQWSKFSNIKTSSRTRT